MSVELEIAKAIGAQLATKLAQAALQELLPQLMTSQPVKLTQEVQPLHGKASGDIRKASERITLGTAMQQGEEVLALFVENEDSRAFDKAKTLSKASGEAAAVVVLGSSQSAQVPARPGHQFFEQRQPGASIRAERGGGVGSLGVFVECTPKQGKEFIGFSACSHVAALSKLAAKGDDVFLPGEQGGDRNTDDVLGTLHSFSKLVHHSEDDSWASIYNENDLAISRVKKEHLNDENWEPENYVPKINQEKVVDFDKLSDVISEKEFKMLDGGSLNIFGRSSGYKRGIYLGGQTTVPLKLANNRVYMYKFMKKITSTSGQSLTMAGDSGCVVYDDEYRLAGFIIGATDRYSIFAPAYKCLQNMRCQLRK